MRTRAQRIDARTDVMEGVDSRDTTIVEAILELCATIDDAAERVSESQAATGAALERFVLECAKGTLVR
jgi:hypothetical protein